MQAVIVDIEAPPPLLHMLAAAQLHSWQVYPAAVARSHWQRHGLAGDVILFNLQYAAAGEAIQLCRRINHVFPQRRLPLIGYGDWVSASSCHGLDDYLDLPADTQRPQRLTEFVALFRQLREREQQIEKLNRANQQLAAEAEALRQQSLTDALTGIANRRSFDETLRREWQRACREQTPLALLLIDIDHFKAYNDVLGHQHGDHVLQQTAQALQAALKRPGDRVARYGGEEFAVILPNTDPNGAVQVALQLSAAVAGLGLPHPATSCRHGRLSVSQGLSACLPLAKFDCLSDLLAAADAALYRTKKAGRDGYSCQWLGLNLPG